MDSPRQHSLNIEAAEDPFLSPLFLSGGEDTSTSSSSNSSSQHSGSPSNAWILQGSLWNEFPEPKSQVLDDLDLSMSLNFPPGLPQDQWHSMDMDTDISAFITDPSNQFSIDPSALQFEGTAYNDSHERIPVQENYDSMFKFTLSQPSDSTSGSTVPFQLPTPHPGSNSSRSASPAPSRSEYDSSAGVNPNELSLLTQLGQKARDAAGVTLAVPAARDSRGMTEGQMPISPVSPILADEQIPRSKVPRLLPSAATISKSQISLAATSQPTPPSSQAGSSPPPAAEPTVAPASTKSGRPKTSHTTIERRYRTNLNARILALRRAVPALRILEKNNPTQTQGKGLTGASATKWDFDDVVNERGYVDGVKAAKKNSKGVVLGKAVEYIKALKRRELRLKRESEGLRVLLTGLVGGPELLREWETEWRERFGGEEADEVDEDEDEEEGDGDVDDGEEADDGDSNDEDGRSKKRARVEKKDRKGKTSPAAQAEKRKRGRPRKNPVSETPTTIPHLVLQPPTVQDQRQPSKYLLAAFVFFNFFNPNKQTAPPSGAHEGTVLTSVLHDTTTVQADPAGWSVLQVVNMIVSVLLLLSLLAPYLPKRAARLLPNALLFAPPASSVSLTAAPKMDTQPGSTFSIHGPVIARALASRDERILRDALGADGSLYSVAKSVGSAVHRSVKRTLHSKQAETMMQREDIELKAWRRVGQIDALRGETVPLLMKIQTYLSFSSRLPAPRISPSDNITLALLAHSFAVSTAAELWDAARRSSTKTSSEALVLELNVDEAAKVIMSPRPSSDAPSDEFVSPVQFIAKRLVLSRTNALAARQFVTSVSGSRVVDLDTTTGGEPSPHNAEVKMVVAAGRELGGTLTELTSLLEKVGRCPAAEVLATFPPFDFELGIDDSELSCSESGSSSSTGVLSDEAAKDARLLLLATLLYRRIFPTEDMSNTNVLSPPPSPNATSAELHLTLRRALASTAFDANPDTEDARDRVVDILAEMGRRRPGGLY